MVSCVFHKKTSLYNSSSVHTLYSITFQRLSSKTLPRKSLPHIDCYKLKQRGDRMLYACITLFFLLVSFPGYADVLLKDNLKKAHEGDYIVTAQGKTLSLLNIHEKTAHSLVIEEISSPLQEYAAKNRSTKSGSPKEPPATALWNSYSVDLASGKVNHSFSMGADGFYEVSTPKFFNDAVKPTLINLTPKNEKNWADHPM